MKRGGLGGALLLAAAAILVLALNRAHTPARAPAGSPPAAPEGHEPLPPEPPDAAAPETPAKSAGRLFGRVTDEVGDPIAGAELLLAERHLAGNTVARTGEDGAYVIDGVEGNDLLLGAVARGYAPSKLLPIRDGPIDFTLRRGGGALSLVVRTEDGSVPETTVIIDPYFKEDDESGGHRVVRSAETTVEGLVPEWNRVLVSARGYAPVFLPVRLHPGGPVEATVTLQAGATLAGAVRTPEGAPVADAKVRSVAWGWRSFATTDAAGAYRIEHLPPGRVEMEAEGAGGNAWALVELESGRESRWDPVLRPAGVISGRVVEEDGTPVAHAVVQSYWSRGTESSLDETETDFDGMFRLTGCRDAAYVVAVWRPGLQHRLAAAEVSVSPDDSPVAITLRRGEGWVRGTVVDRNGAAAAGATIRIWPEARPDREVRARAAADGSFRVGPLPPGAYLVELHLDGEPTHHLRPAIRIVAGETLDLGVTRFPLGGRIRASVVDTTGGVLSPSAIEVLSFDGSVRFAGETDGGVFLSEELTPGRYLVRTAGIVDEATVVAGGVANVELRAGPGGKLTILVTRADGQPVTAMTRIEDAKGRALRDYDYDTTVYLAEGEWRVLAVDGRGRRAEVAVRMGREEQAVVLVLE